MPNEKDKEPKPKEEEEKKVEKVEEAPKWAIELAGKIDKLADAIVQSSVQKAEKKPEEEEKKPEEEKKADAYPKPPEKYPKEEEKKEPEKYPYKEEEKAEPCPEKYPKEKAKEPEKYPYEKKEDLSKMVENAVNAALAKRFTEDPVKKSIVPADNKVTPVDLTDEDLVKMDWKAVHRLAKGMGA